MSSVTMSTTARTGPNAAIAPAGPAAARAAAAGPGPGAAPAGAGRPGPRAGTRPRRAVRHRTRPRPRRRRAGSRRAGNRSDHRRLRADHRRASRARPDAARRGRGPAAPGRASPPRPSTVLPDRAQRTFPRPHCPTSLSVPTCSHAAARAWPRVPGCRRAPRARQAAGPPLHAAASVTFVPRAGPAAKRGVRGGAACGHPGEHRSAEKLRIRFSM